MKNKLHRQIPVYNFGLFVFLVIFPLSIQALDTINHVLLDHAKIYPRTPNTALPTLVPKLTRITSSDAEKAEVLFYWITQNIVYDIEGLHSGNYIMTVSETIRQGKGICHNYAKLYQAMCQEAGLKCHYIGGYAKGFGYDDSKILKEINHAWNAVKIDNEFLFVDATFGSGYAIDDSGNIRYHPVIKIKEVLERPGHFSATHLPRNPIWQLLERPISLENFQAHDTFTEMQASTQLTLNYLDSLNIFLNLEPQWQKVVTAQQTYRFNPTEENKWWLGNAYWGYGDYLSQGRYNRYRLRKSLSSYQEAIVCFKAIHTRSESAQEEIQKIRHNIKFVRSRLDRKR